MRTYIQHLWEQAEASVWSTPAACILASLILSQGTLRLDDKAHTSAWIFVARPDDAATLLSTIASASISLAGLSFSSILVTMTLASGQFGPRLMRNFMKSRTSRVTLGSLLGTYTYCLLVLRGSSFTDDQDFNPQVSAFVASVLTLVCLFVFIYFVQNTLEKIQAENAIYDTHQGLDATIRFHFPELDEQAPLERAVAPTNVEWTIPSSCTGYVQAVSATELLRVATSLGMIVSVPVRAGDFVTPRSTILRVIEANCVSSDISLKAIQACFYIGHVRTPEQDIEYGIRQLVEVGVRALSPGINDPFTAIDCIDYIGSGLQVIFGRELPKSIFRDEKGLIRVYCSVTSYEGLLGTAVNQIRQAARNDCSVTCRLLYMLRGLAGASRTQEQRNAVQTQARLIYEDAADLFNDFDHEAIQTRYESVVQACGEEGGPQTRDAGPQDSREAKEGA